MTLQEAKRLRRGVRVYDKRTGHPFIFLQPIKCWSGLLTSEELKRTQPHIQLACALIRGHDYEGAFYTTGPYITFQPRQIMVQPKGF